MKLLAPAYHSAFLGFRDIQGIAFSPRGTLFGAGNALYTIDPSSGTIAFVGSGGYSNVRGIEVTGIIPEPGAGTLVLLGIGLAIMFGRRRTT